jgi:20S proteasome subunit beta 2
MRNFVKPNERVPKEQSYKFARGTTAYLKESVVERVDLKKYVTIVDLGGVGPSGTVSSEAMGSRFISFYCFFIFLVLVRLPNN